MDVVRNGITRFEITDPCYGRGAARMESPRPYWSTANALYRHIWEDELHRPLLDGDETIQCTRVEAISRYDAALGVDVVLQSGEYGKFTMQEKFLFTDFYTLTIEHCQDWLSLEPGDWYNLEAQYYFVGYARLGILGFDQWVLVDWGALHRTDIDWKLRCNTKSKVGARASFMYVKFDNLPNSVVVARSTQKAGLLLEVAIK